MKFCVIGTGYVGLSLSTLLARKHSVVAVDIVQSKVDTINSGRSPIVDREISEALSSGRLDLRATTDAAECAGADYAIIATPTNYDPETDRFDTGSVDSVIAQVSELNPECTIVVKSTVPIGYTEGKRAEGFGRVVFSPEFLREGRALYDNLHPSRVIVGVPGEDEKLREKAEAFGRALADCAEDEGVPVLVMGSTEAESVKLFSNTYLAMRVAYFNELDSFAELHGLDTAEIIRGVSLDPRIGDWYNNPSFGYGGYCLPKDSKQLVSNFKGTPSNIIEAVVDANATRKRFVAERIAEQAGEGATIGIYRLAMKSGSDNYRETSVLDVALILRDMGFEVVVHEPTLKESSYAGLRSVPDFEEFKRVSDIVVTNRDDGELDGCRVYTRDLFRRD